MLYMKLFLVNSVLFVTASLYQPLCCSLPTQQQLYEHCFNFTVYTKFMKDDNILNVISFFV